MSLQAGAQDVRASAEHVFLVSIKDSLTKKSQRASCLMSVYVLNVINENNKKYIAEALLFFF